tara:strand:- start:1141 stop:1599 length:459 start_codon:yes stop_codon:yes gene_type:complete
VSYWLLKTEPAECSIEDLAAQPTKVVVWEGVRNYQARNFLRQMHEGDEVLVYHSSCKLIGVAGTARISRTVYPDPAQFDPESPYFDPKSSLDLPRWDAVDVVFVQKFSQLLPLDEIKACPALVDLALVKKGNRLSVMPVSANEWSSILELTN